MATNEVGVRVTLEGERQYNEQMRQITQNTKLAAAETKKLETEWGKSSTEKAARQTEQLNQQIERQAQSVEMAKQNVERYSAETGESSSKTLKWKTTLAEAEAELARLRGELDRVPNSLQIYGQKLQDAGQKIKKVGSAMTTAGRTMTTYVTAPIVAVGAAAVKVTADFDSSMSKVMALSGATGDEFIALRDKARQMGATTKFSAGESADALSYMALAGWDTDQMLEGLDGVMNLAAASGMDLADASDLVTDYLTAFGLEAKDSSKMADELAYAQAHSNTTTTQLGEAFGNSAAQMHTAGQSMETTTAILEAFANQGLKGSEAGTALSAMMRDITQKMKNGKIMIGDTAIQVQDANGNFRDMTDILADVEAATDGMGSAEKSAALMTTFTARSVKGVSMALNEGSSAIKGYRNDLYNASGTAKTMADMMQDNLAGQLTMLKSQLSELGISIGDILVPHIRKAVEWIQKQVDKFNSLDDATKEQIVKFAALAAAIGPVLLVGGKLVSSVSSILEGGGKLLKWLGDIAPKFSTLVSAAGPLAGAFGLAAGAGALLGLALKDLKERYQLSSSISDFNEYVLATAGAAEEARKNLSASTEELERTSANAQSVMEECEVSAELTDRYAEELYELAGKSERTVEEQRRMEAIISLLNEMYPGFTQAVMDSNGELKMGVKELKEYVKQLKDSARIKAIQGLIEEYTAKIVEATKRQIEAEKALEEIKDAASQASEQKAQVVQEEISAADKLAEAENKLRSLEHQGRKDTDDYTQALVEYNDAQYNLQHGLVMLNGEWVKATEAMGILANAEETANQETEDFTEQIAETEQAVANAQGEVDDLNEEFDVLQQAAEQTGESEEEVTEQTYEMGESFDETADDVKDAAEELKKAQEEIRKSYDDTYKSAKDSIMGQTGLWDELEEQEETTVENMISALETHEKALREWDQHSSGLLNSQRYQTDEAFRAMVDSVIAGGTDLAPELEVIYELWKNDDERLEELLAHYGNVDTLADIMAKNTAEAATAAEYGLAEMNAAFLAAAQEAQRKPAEVFSNPGIIIDGMLTGAALAGKKAFAAYTGVGKETGKGFGKGATASTKEVKSGTDDVKETAEAGVEKIENLTEDAQTAGTDVGEAIAKGARAARGEIDSAFTSLRAAVSTNITTIGNLKSSAKTAGMNITTNLSDGITSMASYVTTAMNGVLACVEAGITSISGKESDMLSTGKSLGTSLATGLTNKSTDVYNAGVSLGEQLASGISSAQTSAQKSAESLAKAARDKIEEADNADLYKWGNHMGQNFGNGLASAVGAVKLQAAKIAKAVKDELGHTTPKEGPMKDDDVWGLHMGQNFAEGMLKSIPGVESAAYELAEAASIVPTSTTMDIDALTGRNVMEALTLDGLFDVISAAVSNQEMTVQIGNREFARILREQGAIA